MTKNARTLFNQDFLGNFRKHLDLKGIVKKDIKDAWDDPRMFVVEKVYEHVSGAVARLLTNSPTRGERRKIREMAGVSDISDIKNHKRRTAAKAREAIKGSQVANKYGITPDDLRSNTPARSPQDEEGLQGELDRV